MSKATVSPQRFLQFLQNAFPGTTAPVIQSFTSLQNRKAILHRVLVYYITPRTLITIFEYDKGIHSSF